MDGFRFVEVDLTIFVKAALAAYLAELLRVTAKTVAVCKRDLAGEIVQPGIECIQLFLHGKRHGNQCFL